MKKLFIISNESVFESENKYFCDNLDMKSTPEGLDSSFEVNIIARKSKKTRFHEINIKNIISTTSVFSFLKEVIKTSRVDDSKYLIISISPYTFLACIFLRLFRKKPIVYLRSDGYEEYKVIFGFVGSIIYHLMFTVTTKISHLISCRKYILRKKEGNIVLPSQLDENWLSNTINANLDKIKLLYVGRIKIEKGIFSLLDIIKNNNEIELSIVGSEKNLSHNINQKNVSIYKVESSKQRLIKFYDDHNIFILPSFTEGHPMALLEALARKRPVIVFEEIKHVIGNKKGIFVSKRNSDNLIETINHIKKNYKEIIEKMSENNLPTNKDFIKEFRNLILNSQ
jgi:glycosyltransferase involved in cell wall biosynthesis